MWFLSGTEVPVKRSQLFSLNTGLMQPHANCVQQKNKTMGMYIHKCAENNRKEIVIFNVYLLMVLLVAVCTYYWCPSSDVVVWFIV